MKIIKQKKQLMKIISILVSNPWLSELGSHHHIPAAVTPRWPLWRYSRCCSPPMRAQVAKWRWLRWALLEIVVGCGQSMSISCTFPIQKMSFWEKMEKIWCLFEANKKVPTSQDHRLGTRPAGHPGKHKGTCPSALPDPATPMSR